VTKKRVGFAFVTFVMIIPLLSMILMVLMTQGCGGGGSPSPTPTPDPNAFTGYTGRLQDDNGNIVQGVFVFSGQRYTTNTKGEFSVSVPGGATGGTARIEAGTNYFTRVDNNNFPADSVGQRCMPQGNSLLTTVSFRLNVTVSVGQTVSLGTFRLFNKDNDAIPPPCLNQQ
jgi:hypothetical protein